MYSKKGNFSSSNCVSSTLSDRAKQSSITLNHGNTLECKACNFTEKKGADAVKKAHSDSGQHILLGSHDKLDMNNIVCKSKKVVTKNNLVDNQDFFHSKSIPF